MKNVFWHNLAYSKVQSAKIMGLEFIVQKLNMHILAFEISPVAI